MARLVEKLWAIEIGVGKERWIARTGPWVEPTLFIHSDSPALMELVEELNDWEPRVIKVEVREIPRKKRKAVRNGKA